MYINIHPILQYFLFDDAYLCSDKTLCIFYLTLHNEFSRTMHNVIHSTNLYYLSTRNGRTRNVVPICCAGKRPSRVCVNSADLFNQLPRFWVRMNWLRQELLMWLMLVVNEWGSELLMWLMLVVNDVLGAMRGLCCATFNPFLLCDRCSLWTLMQWHVTY